MSYSAYVSCTPFTLVEPLASSIARVEHAIAEVMDDYDIDISGEANGTFTLEMPDTQDVGDSFNERLLNLCKSIQPWVATPFELMLRNCDTASDDRDTFHYGGPNAEAIEAFMRQCAIERAIDALQGVSGVSDLLSALSRRKKASAPNYPTRFEVHEEVKSCGYTIEPSGQANGNLIWRHEASGTSSQETYTLREEAVQAAYAEIQADRVRLRLSLDVVYQRNGHSKAELESQLNRLVQHASGDGLMTGHLASEVIEWSSHVGDLPLRAEPVEIPKVAIILEGGVLQDVVADVSIQATLVDYDTDGAEPSEVVHLTRHQEDGSDTAVVKPVNVHVLPERSQQIHEASIEAKASRIRSAQRGG